MGMHCFGKWVRALAAIVVCASAINAHAVVYDVAFDPAALFGDMQIDVPAPCFVPFPSDNTCAFDVVGGTFTDSLSRVWDIPNDPGIGDAVRLDSADQLTGIQVSISGLIPTNFDSNCDGTQLSFSLDGTVSFECGGHNSDTATVRSITRVPEPSTLALLVAPLVVLVATRRRRK